MQSQFSFFASKNFAFINVNVGKPAMSQAQPQSAEFLMHTLCSTRKLYLACLLIHDDFLINIK